MTQDTNALLLDRAKSHGDFRVQFAIDQSLKNICREYMGPNTHTAVQVTVIEMICHKLSRVLCGDPGFADHWDDIAGYAKLASKEIALGTSPS